MVGEEEKVARMEDNTSKFPHLMRATPIAIKLSKAIQDL
jgi:hypothetical protein